MARLDIAFAGLGGMGSAMVKRLLSQGYRVSVWNRSTKAADDLVALGAQRVSDIGDAFGAGTVLSMLANDAAVDSVFSPEVLDAAPEGAVHVNLATISIQAARAATERHAQAGVGYLSVPVLGRPPVAEQGQLNLLAAGDDALITTLEPVLSSLGRKTWRFGDRPWQANVAKICMNYLLIHALEAIGESLTVAELHGLDPGGMVDLMAESFFPGPVYSGYGHQIAEQRYLPAAFTTELGLKDLDLAKSAAAVVGLELPTQPVLHEIFSQAIDLGLGEHDWASIAEVTRRRAITAQPDPTSHRKLT